MWCHICAKGFKLNEASIDKIYFMRNFTYSQKSKFSKYHWKKDRPTASIL